MPPRKKVDPPVDLSSKKPANADSGDLDAMREEVAAEETHVPAADDKTWPRPIPVGDVTVRVKHWLDWPLDSDRYLAAPDIASWAADVLADDDFEQVWKPAKPTLRQGLKFIRAVEVATNIPFAPHLALLTT